MTGNCFNGRINVVTLPSFTKCTAVDSNLFPLMFSVCLERWLLKNWLYCTEN